MFSLRFVSVVLVSIITMGVAAQDPKPAPDGATPAATATDLAVSVPAFANPNCPIMGGPAKQGLFVDTDYGRIYMCCKGCTKKIQADPEAAWRKAYPKITKLDNKTCPVTGAPIEKGAPTISLQGYEVSLGSKECIKEARENAQTVLAKVLDPKVTVVGNRVCPVTGKAVGKNCVVLIGDHLVNLASADAVAEVRKAPKQMLDKALGKAGQSTPPAKPDPGKKPDERKKSGHEGHGQDHGHDCCHD
jgi:hypothetical protein